MARNDLRLYPTEDRSKLSLVVDENGVVQSSSGADSLASKVIRILFTRKGSDLLDPDKGSIVASLAGSVFNRLTVKEQIVSSVRDVEKYIMDNQASLVLPGDERLRSIEVESIEVGVDSVILRIIVRSFASRATATVVI
jgi:hypothetical protein